MRTAILLPGPAPRWVDHHARHLAELLAGLGRVLVVSASKTPSNEWVLPGEVGAGSLLGNSADGYPLWTGGLTAAIGLRRRQDATVLVLWEGSSMPLAVVSGVIARLRRERLVLDLEYSPGHQSSGATALGERFLARLAASIVRLDPGRADSEADATERVVVAVCGRDTGFARTVHAAFTGLAEEAVTGWRIRLVVDPDTLPWVIEDDRHHERISVHSGSLDEALATDASLVLVPHGTEHTHLVEHAVARGAAGVIVGHPVARRVARRGDGVWLAAHDPSSILVAMESSTNASREHAPVSKAHRAITGDAVVASVARFAEPVGA